VQSAHPPPALEASRRLSIARPAIVYSLLFGAVGAYVPYIALYLGSRGLNLGTVGALIALFAAVSLVAAPSWGAIADGIGDARGPILVATCLAGGAAALLGLATGLPTLAFAIAALAASVAGIVPMVDSRVVRVLGGRDRFGQARASGSAAFVVVAFAAGAVIARGAAASMFALYVPLLISTGIAAWFLLRQSPVSVPGEGPMQDLAARPGLGRRRARRSFTRAASMAFRGLSPSTLAQILSLPRFGLFFIASVAIWTSHAAFQGFVSLRVAALGGDPTTIAATWSLGPLIEVPLMLAFPRVAARVGTERLIVIGAFAFAVRSAIVAAATDPVQIAVAGAFAGFGFAFVYVGTVTWIAGAVSRSVHATAQGMITGTAVSFGAIVGAIVGGGIGGAFGLGTLFAVTAAGYALGGVLVWLAIGRSRASPTVSIEPGIRAEEPVSADVGEPAPAATEAAGEL
jgi:PPP family 3-phenylpropionic acid transporter